MKPKKPYINFYAPKKLVEDFDKAIEGKYNSRTGAIMDLMRRFLLSKKSRFRSVSVPNNLISNVQDVMVDTGSYRSISEFVSEALRLRIEQLKKEEEAKG